MINGDTLLLTKVCKVFMLLFNEDWAKYPTAIRDYNTSNHSFLRLARLYHEMGIKNSTFLLALFQPELSGVDPHDPNLTDEVKVKMLTECQWNPWYFYREVLKIPQGGGVVIPFNAHRGNIAMIWSFYNHIDFANIQPRQTGKSVGGNSIYSCELTTQNATKINLITKDDKLRTQNVRNIKSLIETLPAWFAPRTKEDSNNQEEVTVAVRRFGAEFSRLKTHLARADKKAANNVCRGDSAPILGIDEGAFCVNIQISAPAALGTGISDRQSAKLLGRSYGNLYTTTAGSLDEPEGRYMFELIKGGAIWSEAFLDAINIEHLYTLVETNCSGGKLLINGTFSYKQLGFNDQWMREAMANVMPATPEQIDKDLFNVWRSGKASNPIHIDILKAIAASERDPAHSEITTYGNIVRWYITPEEIATAVNSDDKWILGLDTSNAIDRDAIAGVIISAKYGDTIGAFTCNQSNLVTFATGFLSWFMMKYSNVIIIPENKSSGQGMIDALMLSLPAHNQDPFTRIFNYYVHESDGKYKDEFKDIVKTRYKDEGWYNGKRGKFGFMTDGSKRAELYGIVLQTSAKDNRNKIYDRILSNEIKGLSAKNNRIDHAAGSHDDHVIAWLLAQWLRLQGKHLDYYGIKEIALGYERDEVTTPEQLMERNYNASLKIKMNRMIEQLKREDDVYRIVLLESNIKAISNELSSSEGAIGSIDELLKKIKQDKEEKRINRGGNDHLRNANIDQFLKNGSRRW